MVRDIGNQFINITDQFYNLVIALEKSYQRLRTDTKVPESEILGKFIQAPNELCLHMAMKRFPRMRCYFNAKKKAQLHNLKKQTVRKSNTIRKHLKSLENIK